MLPGTIKFGFDALGDSKTEQALKRLFGIQASMHKSNVMMIFT